MGSHFICFPKVFLFAGFVRALRVACRWWTGSGKEPPPFLGYPSRQPALVLFVGTIYYHTVSSTGGESMYYILVVWPHTNPYPKYTACRYSRLTHAVPIITQKMANNTISHSPLASVVPFHFQQSVDKYFQSSPFIYRHIITLHACVPCVCAMCCAYMCNGRSTKPFDPDYLLNE